MTDITRTVRADVAPTGTLRAGINDGNLILATKAAAGGESRGRGFVANANASGLVARAIENTGACGVSAAPAAPGVPR
ncbi:MAG TPA: hypothetical protein VGU22_06595 [Methylomirabilota bacterium]|jgi:hypothetical protein|nr:hypothetical protein [Methylomirabilota bacterium]